MGVNNRPVPSLLVGIAAALLLLPGVLFVTARLILPADGTQLLLDSPHWHDAGVKTHVLADGSLQEGDLITAINGRTLDARLQEIARRPAAWWSPERTGETLRYEVIRDGQAQQIDVTLSPYPVWRIIAANWTSFLFMVYLQAVSIFIFALRPHLHSSRQLLLLSSGILASGVAFFMGLQALDFVRGWLLVLWLLCTIPLYGYVVAAAFHFILTFPRIPPPLIRRPWLAALIYGSVPVLYAAALLANLPAAHDSLRAMLVALRSTSLLTVLYFTLTVIVTVRTYRSTHSPAEHRQLRWLLWSIMIAVVPWLLLTVSPTLLGLAAADWLTGLLWCAIPTAFAIAILRERLFDIDVIIRRTLIYSSITAILALLYFSGVALIQSVFVLLTGQESPLAVVASTLAIAAVFTPVRRRVQAVVDRRFYRQKYNAEQTVEAFARAVRDEVDIDCVREALLEAVCETMQPEHVTLWLRPSAGIGVSQRDP